MVFYINKMGGSARSNNLYQALELYIELPDSNRITPTGDLERLSEPTE